MNVNINKKGVLTAED